MGEVSPAAQAAGLRPGMALKEAFARCPSLSLVPADPARVAELWDDLVVRLEGIGAAVESERPGEAFFAVDGLLGLYGGEVAGVIAAARSAARMPVRIAVAPNRFAAFVAAGKGSRPPSGALRKFLAPFPVSALTGARLDVSEAEANRLIAALRRLGLSTLGDLAALSVDQLADRFGELGLRALKLARGEDRPLRPRQPRTSLVEEMGLPEGTAGPQLDHALELLVERLLANPERRGRTVLALRLSAQLDSGGSWSIEQVLGRPTAAAKAISALLVPRLETLPEPAMTLRLRALAFGPQASEQLELALAGGQAKRDALGAALREVRATAGAEALLKVIEVDPRSRVPERRVLLGPYPDR